jgi:hypothetical protein
MVKQEVILHTEIIERLGQVKYFQIDLPRDVEKIIGVESGGFRESASAAPGDYSIAGDPIDPLFRIARVETIGRLTLQISDSANIFFQEEVRQKNVSAKYGDYTQGPDAFDQWSHDSKRHESEVNIRGCSPVIEGQFKDSWGLLENADVHYHLNIYIWIEKLA